MSSYKNINDYNMRKITGGLKVYGNTSKFSLSWEKDKTDNDSEIIKEIALYGGISIGSVGGILSIIAGKKIYIKKKEKAKADGKTSALEDLFTQELYLKGRRDNASTQRIKKDKNRNDTNKEYQNSYTKTSEEYEKYINIIDDPEFLENLYGIFKKQGEIVFERLISFAKINENGIKEILPKKTMNRLKKLLELEKRETGIIASIFTTKDYNEYAKNIFYSQDEAGRITGYNEIYKQEDICYKLIGEGKLHPANYFNPDII